MELLTIPLNQIEFGERFRKKYENVGMLAESIRANGNIQLMSVSINPDVEQTGKPYLLAVGGRRFKAFTWLVEHQNCQEFNTVQVCYYDKVLTELERRSIEAAENIDREEFTYGERCAILKHINDLQISIHGEKFARTADAPGWSKADTARMVNKSPASVSQDIELAEAIEDFPELKLDKMKNKSEAMKRLKKAQTIIVKQKLAENYANTLGSTDAVKKKLINAYIIEDFFTGVKKIPEGTIDIVELDPPYAIDLKKNKKANDCLSYNEISAEDYLLFMSKVLKECYRVMKTSSWIVVWFGPEPWFEDIYKLLIKTGFYTNRMCGIWTKGAGQTNQPHTRLANSYEMFFYAFKGHPHLNMQGRINSFDYKPVHHTSKIHPTERPLELTKDILHTFARPGSQVMIPFLGSGNTIIAAHECQMDAFGFELGQPFKDSYIIRLNELY